LIINQLQDQESLYNFPLDFAITTLPGSKSSVLKNVTTKKQSETFVFPVSKKPITVEMDLRKVLLSTIELMKVE